MSMTQPSWWSRELATVEPVFRELLATEYRVDFPRIIKAWDLARECHSGQEREGGGAYIIHPLRVAISLSQEFEVKDPELLIAALLHDVLEDSICTPERVKAISEQAGSLVETLSRRPDEKRPREGDPPGSPYFERIRSSRDAAILLKVADKIDNLRDALYHPSPEKRRVYVAETAGVYGPLLDALPDGLRQSAQSILEGAIEGHSLRSLISILDDAAAAANSGEPVTVPAACLDTPLLHYLLFNPRLTFWLNYDGIQLTKSIVRPADLVCDVAKGIAQLVRDDVGTLLKLAGLPKELAKDQRHWGRANAQLRALVDLLRDPETPAWRQPTLDPESLRWMLLLVHSIVFLPADWIFPMWHRGYAGALAGSSAASLYNGVLPQAEAGLCHRFLRFLLGDREALWRASKGIGTMQPVKRVFAAAIPAIPTATLWSARLFSEYLDVVTGTVARAAVPDVSKSLEDLWDKLRSGSFRAPQAHTDPLASDTEFIGREEVRQVFLKKEVLPELAEEEKSDNFQRLLQILVQHVHRDADDLSRWVAFETAEFLKRWPEIFGTPDGGRFPVGSTFADLEECGVRCREERDAKTVVLRVLPSRRSALRNRLPEVTDSALNQIKQGNYSATAIFDTLVLDKMGAGEPVWVPRVYRILDTIEDLDPEHVQSIDISLREPYSVAPFRTCLPLPESGESAECQKRRKEVVARYLVAQIYNYGVARRVLSASVECAGLSEEMQSHGLTNRGLIEMLGNVEREYGFQRVYGSFIESFNFIPFRIQEETAAEGDLPFGIDDINTGVYIGMDIGGTDTKFAVFDKGEAQSQEGGKLLGSTPTFAEGATRPVEANAFFSRLVSKLSLWLSDPAATWPRVNGLGVSWPGAVRENRVACISGTLGGITHKGEGFPPDVAASRIHAFPFLAALRGALADHAEAARYLIDRGLTLILENDGNAEAFGNFCARVQEGKHKPGGKLVLKLGTSLAGGRVLRNGSLADDVAEFSKIVLDLNTQKSGNPQGVARNYVSSLGVRNLSRTFEYRQGCLFGTRNGANTEACARERIEAIEIGELLGLWYPAAGQAGHGLPTEWAAYLEHLVETDNQPEQLIAAGWIARLENGFVGDLGEPLGKYIRDRGGEEWESRHAGCSTAEPGSGPCVEWQRGLARTHWLCTGQRADYAGVAEGVIPKTFPFGKLAEKIAGSVALFSQLSLQIAHIVAALYNIYRRDSFTEVLLAGGVLSGKTGELVKCQTEAFLLKYYDKIFGKGRHLPPDAIQLGPGGARKLMGPFGAAMLANRAHKSARLVAMRRQVERLVNDLRPGEAISLAAVTDALGGHSIAASEAEVRDALFAKVAASALIPGGPDGPFVRCIEAPAS
jgi:hypothetical protein